MNDNVQHPPHYTQGSVECIDAMESAFGKEQLATYCKIAAFKYIWREENKGGVARFIDKGERIAQLVICKCETPELEVVDELEETERGSGCFGSTGR